MSSLFACLLACGLQVMHWWVVYIHLQPSFVCALLMSQLQDLWRDSALLLLLPLLLLFIVI